MTRETEPNWKYRAKLAMSILGHAKDPAAGIEDALLALQGAEIDEIARIREGRK